MTNEMKLDLWRLFISFAGVVSIALGAYIAAVLARMKREQDSRARDNEARDLQRSEIASNLRTLLNGEAKIYTTPRLTGGAHRERGDRRRGPRRESEIKRNKYSPLSEYDDIHPSEEPERLQGE